MYRLVETIQVKNSQFTNLQYHQQRFERSQQQVFGVTQVIQIAPLLQTELRKWQSANKSLEQIVKCRFEYDTEIHNISFEPYTRKRIVSLQLVVCNDAEYTYKSTDRRFLSELMKQVNGCDEILICRNGVITDTSFTNVVLFDGQTWFTPSDCLLKGTKRQSLLDTKRIIEKSITIDDLENYQKIRLINAMIDFEDEVDIDIHSLQF